MSNTRSQLEQLLPEIASEGVAPNLDKKDIANVRCASKGMNTLFAPVSDVAKLLSFVQGADYDEAEKMVADDPHLMFKYVSYKNKDGSFETISPLKFAFKVLDTYMWKMFLEKISGCNNIHILKAFPCNLEKYKNSHILVAGRLYAVDSFAKAEETKIQNPGYFKYFRKQLEEQKEYINLEPLSAEYKRYDEQYNLWFQHHLSNDDVDKAWLNLGKKQRNILPQHMLKEFCRKGFSWRAESNFDVAEHPCPNSSKIYNFNTGGDESLLPFGSNCRLGVAFALIRGDIWRTCCASVAGVCGVLWDPSWRTSYVLDSAVFSRLCEVRTDDLVTLRSQLDLLSSENTCNIK